MDTHLDRLREEISALRGNGDARGTFEKPPLTPKTFWWGRQKDGNIHPFASRKGTVACYTILKSPQALPISPRQAKEPDVSGSFAVKMGFARDKSLARGSGGGAPGVTPLRLVGEEAHVLFDDLGDGLHFSQAELGEMGLFALGGELSG